LRGTTFWAILTAMSVRIVARSISRSALERLQGRGFAGRVLAVFERACDLVAPDGGVVALVLPGVGDGPLNIVVEGGLPAVEPGAPARLEGERLMVGGAEVALEGAAVWEPRPDWERLRARRGAIAGRLPLLHDLALSHAPQASLLTPARDRISGGVGTAVRQAAADLLAGWEGGRARLRAGAARLAGLGAGLTPAGDDFLTGVMLWAWLAHPTPAPLCRLLVEAAATRTTTLSAAFLHAAARGECSAAWHALLAALADGDAGTLERAVANLLARGATSGADALAGFLLRSAARVAPAAPERPSPPRAAGR